jgi:hypothetical protein
MENINTEKANRNNLSREELLKEVERLAEEVEGMKSVIGTFAKGMDKMAELQAIYAKNLELFVESQKNGGGVFISYSHADTDIVIQISKKFQEDNISHWIDEKDILIGEVIDKEISKGIQNNFLFLVVLSPSSIKSKWVEREFDEASYEEIEGKKFILPVVVNGLPDVDIPARIRRKLYVNLSNDFEAGYQKLRKSIVSYILKYSKPKQQLGNE